MEPEKIQTSLPENAYRELKPGEEYQSHAIFPGRTHE